jgi:tryptophan synthase alpha chain
VSRIPATFKRLRWEKEAAFIPYVPVGYPSLEVTRQLVPLIARQGADLIEIGAPLRDVSLLQDTREQRGSNAALLADCLSVAADSRRANEVPLVLTSKYGPIGEYGLARIADDCAAAGVDGLLVTDLPLDEARGLKAACAAVGVDLIFQLRSGSTDDYISRAIELASGYIYCDNFREWAVAGAPKEIEQPAIVERVRQYTNLPLVVGFGTATVEQLSQAAQYADGVKVVTALEGLISSLPEDEVLYGVGEFIREMKGATKKAEA